MKRKKEKKPEAGAPKWMVTYSDMITLILVFFILLFSMSQIDAAKFEAVSESFKNRAIFDFLPSAVPLDNQTDSPADLETGKDKNDFDKPAEFPKKEDQDENEDNEKDDGPLGEVDKDDSLDILLQEIESYLNANELNGVIAANRTEQGVVLVLQDSLLFEPGQAEILDTGKPFLTKIGGLLLANPNDVRIEGHTDSKPMATYRYPSNWELSGARASSVVRHLIGEYDFDMSRFSIVGYGETQPVVPNTSEENMSKNRRVEIVILGDTIIDEKVIDVQEDE